LQKEQKDAEKEELRDFNRFNQTLTQEAEEFKKDDPLE